MIFLNINNISFSTKKRPTRKLNQTLCSRALKHSPTFCEKKFLDHRWSAGALSQDLESHIFFRILVRIGPWKSILRAVHLHFGCHISKVNLYAYEWSKIFKPDKCIFSFVLGNTGSMVVLDPFVILAYNGISSWHRNTTQIGIPLLKKSTQCLNTSMSCATAYFNSKLVI